MEKSLLDSEGLNLRYGEGTVGEYIQRGRAGLSVRNLWQLALLLFLALCAATFVLNSYGGYVDEIIYRFTGATVSTAAYVPVLTLSCVLLLLAAVALIVVSFRTRGTSHDRRQQLRTQVLSMMAKNPRYPVGMKSQLSAVGLRCIYLKGARAIECSSRYPFVAEDFRQGSMSSQSAARSLFDAYDFEVFKGRLYVYYDVEAADEIREKRYKKGERSHG